MYGLRMDISYYSYTGYNHKYDISIRMRCQTYERKRVIFPYGRTNPEIVSERNNVSSKSTFPKSSVYTNSNARKNL